jgi:hypothetical protein
MHLSNKNLFRGRYLYWDVVHCLLIYSFLVLTCAKQTAGKEMKLGSGSKRNIFLVMETFGPGVA